MERKAAFLRAAIMLDARGPEHLAESLIGMMRPISEDVKDLVNRYGDLGLPYVAAALKLTAGGLEALMDESARTVYTILLKHGSSVVTVARKKGQHEGEEG